MSSQRSHASPASSITMMPTSRQRPSLKGLFLDAHSGGHAEEPCALECCADWTVNIASMLCSCWICQVSLRAQHRAKVGRELRLLDSTALALRKHGCIKGAGRLIALMACLHRQRAAGHRSV